MTKVLVIDDEAPIRLLCRVNLEAEGMDVIEAADGPSGVETAGAWPSSSWRTSARSGSRSSS